MRTGGKLALTVRGACLAAGLTFLSPFAYAEHNLDVAISSESVSITADNITIRRVLEELSEKSNLIVVSEEALDELVTVDVVEQTLPETIRRLLRQKSFMLHQSTHPSGSSPYFRLWIMSSASSAGRQSWRSGTSDSELIENQILALSEKSGEREDAMVGFGDFSDGSAIDFLQQGLFDPDENVREAAIESLAELGGTDSVRALSLVLNDPDAGIRIDAVDALGEIGGTEAIELLKGAMADDNHTVREVAAEWITELAWQHE
jgi:hypothetical protein